MKHKIWVVIWKKTIFLKNILSTPNSIPLYQTVLNFQQLDSDPDYPITTSDIQTSSFTTDCIDLTSVTSEQSERNTNSQNTSAISQHPLPNETDPANKLPPLPIPRKRPPKYAKKKLTPWVYFVILHQSKYTKYLGKSMAMLYTK